MTDTLPEVEEVKRRLLLMADQGDFGRKPDAADVRRRAVTLIDQLQRDNAALREGLEALRNIYGADGFQMCGEQHRERVFAEVDALLNPSNTGGR